MTDQEVSGRQRRTDTQIFLDSIPENGDPIGNKSLLSFLGWDEEKFWRIRQSLLDEGKIIKGKGKGGSVYKVVSAPEPEEIKILENKTFASERSDDEIEFAKEKDLYAPFKTQIQERFCKDQGLSFYVSVDVSSQGKRDTGGIWTRPDIAVVSVTKYPFYIHKAMDIITFEIKTQDNWNITSVFETLSHTRFATKSYLVIYLPEGWDANKDYFKKNEEKINRIQSECERFGIGLMFFSDPKDYNTYEIMVDPVRKLADPDAMNDFIKKQIPEKEQMEILKFIA
ncbi:hypothetical protein HGB47_14920 [Leptospira yasudae]|uniref:hypothetical protein n=1 Tax=Leptospira yasudae TaxID=2202201 RepID=UPI001C4FFBEE|nr:hypothetical protein [Leptospira yasudae]MBW0434909.1 hypothetical protein [Leptospira yasudae]